MAFCLNIDDGKTFFGRKVELIINVISVQKINFYLVIHLKKSKERQQKPKNLLTCGKSSTLKYELSLKLQGAMLDGNLIVKDYLKGLNIWLQFARICMKLLRYQNFFFIYCLVYIFGCYL